MLLLSGLLLDPVEDNAVVLSGDRSYNTFTDVLERNVRWCERAAERLMAEEADALCRRSELVRFVALTQISRRPEGRAYYLQKKHEGKTTEETLRCLKRGISDRIFNTLRPQHATPSLHKSSRWQVVRRYMSAESLAKARLNVIEGEEEARGELEAAS